MRILLLNLRCDVDYPPLAFAHDWVSTIAANAESVTVITNFLGRFDVPANVRVRSLGGETGASNFVRLWRLYKYTLEAILEEKVDICFAHMTPMFAALIAPVCRIFGCPIVLWYAHSKVGIWLRVGAKLVNRCVTSSAAGFQLRAHNLIILQQGISVARILNSGSSCSDPARFTIINIGRISALKRLEIAIEAISIIESELRQKVYLEIIGDPLTNEDKQYLIKLGKLISDLGLENVVSLHPSVPFERLVEVFSRADAAINCAPFHSLDKAALEAMASGLPCIVTNEAFSKAVGDAITPLLVSSGRPKDVARVIADLARSQIFERKRIGQELAKSVIEKHSLPTLVRKLFKVFANLTGVNGPAV